MEAENEDEFFKQTGYEQDHFMESLFRGKYGQDEDFQKVA